MQAVDMTISALQQAYINKALTPAEVVDNILQQCKEHADNPIWITQLSKAQIQPYLDKLADKAVEDLPLYGIPFAIKDNIDLAGVPTTAACKEFSYTPEQSATVVQHLIAAGAIPIGKTNLDQFATGLNGTRSPWGAVQNSFNKNYISGGSSSGSSVAVALGLVSFSLGTDTAGSGRVPAAFNNIIGLKPSRGLISAKGVVPACQSLDCVSIFALTLADSQQVLSVAERFDAEDPYSRERGALSKASQHTFTVGVPAQKYLEFFGDKSAQQLFAKAMQQWQSAGADIVEIDFAPFVEAATLLYNGPWVAERYAALENLMKQRPEVLNPTIRAIIEPAVGVSAVDGFKAFYQLQALKKKADAILTSVDFMVTPTAPTIYTIEDMLANPIELNSRLGHYTNFMNLFDYSAVAVPAGFLDNKLPWGVTLFAQAFSDNVLLSYAEKFLQQYAPIKPGTLDVTDTLLPIDDSHNTIDFIVCGAHLSGMVLNHQLLERNAVLVKSTTTAEIYSLYALAGGPPYRPGLMRDEENGKCIDVEVWRMPVQHFGSFMQLIPHPLGIGTVELVDGSWCKGFICEAYTIQAAKNITDMQSWRVFIQTLASK